MFDNVNEEVYTLPSSVRYEDEDYTVTSIAAKGLRNGRNNKVCKKIIVPSSIVSIGAYAFLYFCNVTEIILPPKLTKIEKSTFAQCQSLETIVIPDGVVTIEDNAFKGCQALKSITLPKSLQNIYGNAFEETGIKELVLPEGMTKLSMGTFRSMRKLQKIVIPSSVIDIEEGTFAGCERLQEITLPRHLELIKERTFASCVSLENIVIPDNVYAIGTLAFENCSALKQITLPKSMLYIDAEVFKGCTELKTIYSYAVIPPSLGQNPFDGSGFVDYNGQIIEGATVYVPKGCAERYKNADKLYALTTGWNELNIVEMDVEPELPANFSDKLENTHKKLSLLANAKGDEKMIASKYISVYDSYAQQEFTTSAALDIYDIQLLIIQLVNLPNSGIIKSLAKELKAAKTLDVQKQIFLKYVAQK